jgi:hypothetical protein
VYVVKLASEARYDDLLQSAPSALLAEFVSGLAVPVVLETLRRPTGSRFVLRDMFAVSFASFSGWG